VEPNKTDAWEDAVPVGSTPGICPSLVCDSDDTLHLAYQSHAGDESSRSVCYRSKKAGEAWTEAKTIVGSEQVRGFGHFENALHLDVNDCLWMVFHLFGIGGDARGMGFGLIRSTDSGNTWEDLFGSTLTLPITHESSIVRMDSSTSDVVVGNLATDSKSVPYFALSRRDGGCQETFLYRWADGEWRSTLLLPPVEEVMGPCAMLAPWALSISDTNQLYLAGVVGRPDADWSDASNEVILLTSRDRGQSFRVHRVSPGTPGVPSWLPSLERHTGHNPVTVPHLMYTHGFDEMGSEPGIDTDVRFVSLQRIAEGEDELVKDAFSGVLMLSGLTYPAEIQNEIWSWVEGNQGTYRRLREMEIGYDVEPCLDFIPGGRRADPAAKEETKPFKWGPRQADRPGSDEDLAFQPVSVLSELIRTKEISPVELTRLYLNRCSTYGAKLACVVTLTDELAMRQARKAEDEIAAGNYRGPLHGIPWGAKDLLAAKGYPTTWGATPFKEQVLQKDAEVVRRLGHAGAVLVAKLSMGALAMGPNWFGGTTLNPWNIKEDSSGSSAGPGSATAAGMVGFSIGTETQGSIVGPSHKCGLAGLRPTYGRVPRTGGMVLSWTMDKIGPMCREVEDCAAVLSAIYGPDGVDTSVADVPFEWLADRDVSGFRVGYLEDEFDGMTGEDADLYQGVLEVLRGLGMEPKPVHLPKFPYGAVGTVLTVEAAAMFDDITRSGEIDLTAEYDQSRWPKMLRVARTVPAVEYLRAQRIRRMLTREIEDWMQDWDVVLGAVFSGSNGSAMNLSGHPCITVPCGFVDGMPRGINFLGRLYDEATILAAGRAYEQATEWHRRHPDMSKVQ